MISGQNSQEFRQKNLLKSCIGSLEKSYNSNRMASPPDLAHCVSVSTIIYPGNTIQQIKFFGVSGQDAEELTGVLSRVEQ